MSNKTAFVIDGYALVVGRFLKCNCGDDLAAYFYAKISQPPFSVYFII